MQIKRDDPYPVPVKKLEALQDYSFDVVDNIALSATHKELLQKSEENLVKTLTRVCFDDLRKVRILFRWLSSLKLPELHLDDKIPNSVSFYLNKLYKEEEDYSTIFQRLCK